MPGQPSRLRPDPDEFPESQGAPPIRIGMRLPGNRPWTGSTGTLFVSGGALRACLPARTGAFRPITDRTRGVQRSCPGHAGGAASHGDASQHLYEVNRTHQLVREGLEPLFRAERERIGQVLDALRTVLGRAANRIASAAVFGSAARGQDRPGSDLDVLVVAKDDSDVEPLHSRLADSIPRMEEEFGLDLSPAVLRLSQFREMHRTGDSLVSDVLRDARLITGERPEALVHG
jgi:predicted nucleotidyltransferase